MGKYGRIQLFRSRLSILGQAPSLIVVAGYGVAFYFMALSLRSIPLGIMYAVWAGVGIVLMAIVGAFLYNEVPDLPAMIGMGLIISGVVVIHVFSKTIVH